MKYFVNRLQCFCCVYSMQAAIALQPDSASFSPTLCALKIYLLTSRCRGNERKFRKGRIWQSLTDKLDSF